EGLDIAGAAGVLVQKACHCSRSGRRTKTRRGGLQRLFRAPRHARIERCDSAEPTESAIMRLLCWSLLIVAVCGSVAPAAETTAVRGRVVDEAGRPVADVDVDFHWRANGSGRDKDGQLILRADDPDSPKEFWAHVGEMAPSTDAGARGDQRTGADGRF